jgi:hypothetical protein
MVRGLSCCVLRACPLIIPLRTQGVGTPEAVVSRSEVIQNLAHSPNEGMTFPPFLSFCELKLSAWTILTRHAVLCGSIRVPIAATVCIAYRRSMWTVHSRAFKGSQRSWLLPCSSRASSVGGGWHEGAWLAVSTYPLPLPLEEVEIIPATCCLTSVRQEMFRTRTGTEADVLGRLVLLTSWRMQEVVSKSKGKSTMYSVQKASPMLMRLGTRHPHCIRSL